MKFVPSIIVPWNYHISFNCLDRVVLAHPFWAMATFPICFSALSCWTNRGPSMVQLD